MANIICAYFNKDTHYCVLNSIVIFKIYYVVITQKSDCVLKLCGVDV